MKNIIISIILALMPIIGHAQETRSQATLGLMGLGMPAVLAEKVAGLSTGLAILPNATWVVARNAAGSANINVLRVDGNDDTWLNSDTGDEINFSVAGTGVAQVHSGGLFPYTDGSATANLGASNKGWKNIYMSDATNRGSLLVSGGFYINHPATQNLFIRENATTRWTFSHTSGNLVSDTTNGGSIVFGKAGTGVTVTPEAVTAAGSVQGDGGVITGLISLVSGADATKGVVLPATPVAGQVYIVINSANAVLKIWPASGDAISGLGANNNMALAAYTSAICVAVSASQYWCSEPAVAA